MKNKKKFRGARQTPAPLSGAPSDSAAQSEAEIAAEAEFAAPVETETSDPAQNDALSAAAAEYADDEEGADDRAHETIETQNAEPNENDAVETAIELPTEIEIIPQDASSESADDAAAQGEENSIASDPIAAIEDQAQNVAPSDTPIAGDDAQDVWTGNAEESASFAPAAASADDEAVETNEETTETQTDGAGAQKAQKAPTPKAEKKKPLGEKQKRAIWIGAVAAVLVVALVLGISLPIYFANRGKIFVSTAEDFVNAESKGDYFVLQKDVTVDGDLTLDKNVDLAGYTLSVGGTLTLNAGADALGTKKGDEYADKGALNVGALIVDQPDTELNLAANLQAQTVQIKAKSLRLGGVSLSGDSTLSVSRSIEIAREVQIKRPLTIEGCADVSVMADVVCVEEGALDIKDCDVTVAAEVSVGNLQLNRQIKDGDEIRQVGSSAQIYGKIGALQGGRKVAMLQGHECAVYRGVQLLAIADRGDKQFEIYDCDRIVYIDRLDAPEIVQVQEEKGSVVARVSKVEGALGYVFIVDGKPQDAVAEPYLDVSEILKGGAGKHTVGVYAKGNYSFDRLEELVGQNANADEPTIVYADGGSVATVYAYTITLTMPAIEMRGETLVIHTVDFADYYSVYIGDLHLSALEKVNPDQPIDGIVYDKDNGLIQIDLSSLKDQIPVGSYGVLVSAHSNFAEITSSKPALESYVRTGAHAQAEITEASDLDTEGLIVTWNAVSTAKTYRVTIEYEDGAAITVVTSNTQLRFDAKFNDNHTVNHAAKVTVTAQKNGAYEASVSELNFVRA